MKTVTIDAEEIWNGILSPETILEKCAGIRGGDPEKIGMIACFWRNDKPDGWGAKWDLIEMPQPVYRKILAELLVGMFEDWIAHPDERDVIIKTFKSQLDHAKIMETDPLMSHAQMLLFANVIFLDVMGEIERDDFNGAIFCRVRPKT